MDFKDLFILLAIKLLKLLVFIVAIKFSVNTYSFPGRAFNFFFPVVYARSLLCSCSLQQYNIKSK